MKSKLVPLCWMILRVAIKKETAKEIFVEERNSSGGFRCVLAFPPVHWSGHWLVGNDVKFYQQTTMFVEVSNWDFDSQSVFLKAQERIVDKLVDLVCTREHFKLPTHWQRFTPANFQRRQNKG